jgi:hypothetical protein
VKTHYNNFKNDVIFTLVKDIPNYKIPDDKKEDLRPSLEMFWSADKHTDISITEIDMTPKGNGSFNITFSVSSQECTKSAEIQNGKIYINDMFTGVWCDVDSWEEGTVWSMCYSEAL